MEKSRYLLLTILICTFFIQIKAQNNIWTVGTALTIKPRNMSIAAFQQSRYGITRELEVFAHPLAFPVFQNIGIKRHWYTTESGWFLSTRHAINCPTLFLKITSRKGAGGIVPENTKVPFILGFTNEFLASTFLIKETSCTVPDLLLTLKLGSKMAAKFGENTVPTIDYPVIYQQTIIYQKKKRLWYIGADLDGRLTDRVNFCIDVDFLSVNLLDDYAIEHKGLIIMPVFKRMTFVAGYKISFGTYPYGNDFMFSPLIDIMWDLYRKKKREKDLFDKRMKI